MPSKYIYEPIAAPKSVQKAAKCIVGYNYPVPMINHAKANAINLERMKMLYRQLAQKTGTLKLLRIWELKRFFPVSWFLQACGEHNRLCALN